MKSTNRVYDVAIIGAGPGGSAAAHFLAKSGLDVLLLDKADFPRDKTCGDGLTPRALHVLSDMGLLGEITRNAYRIDKLELHSKTGRSIRSNVPAHPSFPDHLLVIPRLKLDELVMRHALSSGANLQENSTVRHVESHRDHALLHVKTGQQLRQIKARVAIVAIGANIAFLKKIGILQKTPAVLRAVRAYFEGLPDMHNRIQAHFAHVPNPGYGWIFPTSASSANIGVGFWMSGPPWKKRALSTRHVFSRFVKSPKLREILASAKQVGPPASYPLRIDFASAPTFSKRILLIGEAAGLVSPLTGEGIDFAMESASLVASFLKGLFSNGDFSHAAFSEYDHKLRQKFQTLFRSLELVRRVYLNPFLMSRALSAAEKNRDLKKLLVGVMLSQQQPREILRPNVLRRILVSP